jgi:uncharacterized SAM-binding protein YcdF (DUF218 family)
MLLARPSFFWPPTIVLLRPPFRFLPMHPRVGADTMSYVPVFEITHEALPLWIPIFFVLFNLFGAIFLLLARNSGFVRWFFMSFILLFACVWAATTSYYFRRRTHDIQTYQSRQYKAIEGPVEHYSWNGKHECFSVRGVEFCHGTANTVGWDPPLRLAPSTWPVGLLREGLTVRVAYSSDQSYPRVLRLDIARNPQ